MAVSQGSVSSPGHPQLRNSFTDVHPPQHKGTTEGGKSPFLPPGALLMSLFSWVHINTYLFPEWLTHKMTTPFKRGHAWSQNHGTHLVIPAWSCRLACTCARTHSAAGTSCPNHTASPHSSSTRLGREAGVCRKIDQWSRCVTEGEPSTRAVCGGAGGIFEKGDFKGRLT